MTTTPTPPVRATCPVCQTPDLIVNPSGTLRKHDCEPVAEEAPVETAPEEAAPDDAGGASSFGDEVTATGGASGVEPVEPVEPVEVVAPSPSVEPVEARRYCRRENCGKKPWRHGWCAQDHATHCDGGR